MKTLKELLAQSNYVWFAIKSNKKQRFLIWAKQNGCRWNNKPIDPNFDYCGNFMGISQNGILGYVGGHCWFNSINKPQKINF